MRISDWSSDVCSSDLLVDLRLDRAGVGDLLQTARFDDRAGIATGVEHFVEHVLGDAAGDGVVGDQIDEPAERLRRNGRFGDALAGLVEATEQQIGGASCRERGGQYV